MDKPSNVVEFIRGRMAAIGLNAEGLAEVSRSIDGSVYDLAAIGEGELPLQHIAEMARLLGADALELLRHHLHDHASETYEAVADRFDDALTRDELAIVRAMRRALGGPYLVSQTPLQLKKMHEWLDALREFPSGLN